MHLMNGLAGRNGIYFSFTSCSIRRLHIRRGRCGFHCLLTLGSRLTYLAKKGITENKLDKIRELNDSAQERGQSLAQMAIAWILKDERITSVLVGVSKISQIEDNIVTLTIWISLVKN